jgi:hypothetical protein
LKEISILDKTLALYDFGSDFIMKDFGRWKESEPNHFEILVKFISEIDLKEKLVIFNVILDNNKISKSYGILENGKII